ncbi:MAG TPA: hypothetical protein VJ969_07040 [Desulfopila sp.]|nr:hypothetical protein [Desulfopila sp.]
MKTQQKLDKVLEAVRQKSQEEVGSLMGVEFKMSHLFNKLVDKEEFFDEQASKKVVARIDVTGEIEGHGGLVIGVRDAIRLGGTLIMLPLSELDEAVKSENYTEEIEDSYGEIANIIAGSYTKVFEEMFPKNCRFVRKEQALVVPQKVEKESPDPFADQWYYWVKASMKIDDQQMDDLDMLIPAEPFGLDVPQSEKEPLTPQNQEEESEQDQTTAQEEQKEAATPDEQEQAPASSEQEEAAAADEQQETPESEGLENDEFSQQKERPALLTSTEGKKQKKKIDTILKNCSKLVADEVGALLGVDVHLDPPENKYIDKEEFFGEEASGRQMLARMDVMAEHEGSSYLFVGLKDVIRLGSILIMLPPSEMETAIGEEELSADTEDAYGEVANIISGVYTQVFQEHYSKSMRFVKTGLEVVSPLKVDTQSDDVIPEQSYYLSSSKLKLGDRECGQVAMLFPVDILQLAQVDDPGEAADTSSAGEELQPAQHAADSSRPSGTGGASGDEQRSGADTAIEVLIVENDAEEAKKIETELKKSGVTAKCVSFKENISLHLTSELRLIIIVMQEIDEQAYGVLIKVNTQSTAPIVAAGSEWTRSKVIKAVKYGVHDILVTPATDADIHEKVEHNIIKMAA